MTGKRKIVSSAHLVSDDAGELSEFEYGLIVCANAFDRWKVRCARAAGLQDVGALDVQILHTLNSRGRDKTLAELCLILNIEDTHTVNYSLKKLIRLGLVDAGRHGKERHYRTTASGHEACRQYRSVREDCLVEVYRALGTQDEAEVRNLAQALRALSGLYDQASRAATSL